MLELKSISVMNRVLGDNRSDRMPLIWLLERFKKYKYGDVSHNQVGMVSEIPAPEISRCCKSVWVWSHFGKYGPTLQNDRDVSTGRGQPRHFWNSELNGWKIVEWQQFGEIFKKGFRYDTFHGPRSMQMLKPRQAPQTFSHCPAEPVVTDIQLFRRHESIITEIR